MSRRELKHKIRELKIMEFVIRYGYTYDFVIQNRTALEKKADSLIWHIFFNLQEKCRRKCEARYNLETLEKMDKAALKEVIDEYWFTVYYQIYKEQGLPMGEWASPELLNYLGLPFGSDENRIKKRFRELCKRYHPDSGGDADKFMELMDIAEKHLK
ncbi:MAG: J domain-containing protein [Lachnospiraceae bacterium]|jgi:hypothetical protein|nr:J domain-containing protein [Lachnospiraceae bacterium]